MRPDVLANHVATTIRRLHAPLALRVAALETATGTEVNEVRARLAVLEGRAPLPGPPGPPGAPGRDGVDGKDGRDGLNGKDGAGLRWLGVHVPGKTYEVTDLVTAGGSTWALRTNDDRVAGALARLAINGQAWARRARGPLMPLVSLADAKTHLHITDPAQDAEVTIKLRHASTIIIDKCDTLADDTWNEATAPDAVQAATLVMLAHLWEHRGDDLAPDNHETAVWNQITLLLKQWWKPALA